MQNKQLSWLFRQYWPET